VPAIAVNPRSFTVESARAAGLKSAAIKALRRSQREAAAVAARSSEANNALVQVNQARSTISRADEAKSTAVHALLAVEAVKQAETLAKAERNEPGVFKIVVEACDKLFGWSRSDGPNTLVQVNYLNDLTPQPVVSCGVAEPDQVSITSEQTAQIESKH
jgi:hypothetical protein